MSRTSFPSPGLALPAGTPGFLSCSSLSEALCKLGAWREAVVLRQALNLANQPNSILDIPCGTGRLWPLLLEKANRLIIGADDCAEMLAVARATVPPAGTGQLRYLRTAAEAIDLPDSAVDCIFCVRLFARLGGATHRQQLLQEFHRVTRDTLILSLWVDGNYRAWRRQATRQQPTTNIDEAQTRFVVSRAQIETEFAAAGFEQLGHFDLVPFYHMSRIYVLRKH